MKSKAILIIICFLNIYAYGQVEYFSTAFARQKIKAAVKAAANAAVTDSTPGSGTANTSDGTLSALPSLLSGLNGKGNTNVVPTINVIGNYIYQNNLPSGKLGALVMAQVFTGFNQADTSSKVNLNRLWIEDASNFGFNFTAGFGGIRDSNNVHWYQAFFLRTSISIVGKPSATKDSAGGIVTTDYTGMLHYKLGLEFSPVSVSERAEFIAYFNFDFVTPLSNVQQFNDFYHYTGNTNFKFWDVGMRIPFTIINNSATGSSPGSNLTLSIDGDLIGITKSIKAIYPTSDKVIPVITLGVKQSFGW